MAISRLASKATTSTLLFTNLLPINRSPQLVAPVAAALSFVSGRFARSIHIGMPSNYRVKEAVEQNLKYLDLLERSRYPFMRRGSPSSLLGVVSGDKVYVRIDMAGVGKRGLRVVPEEDYYVIEESNNDEDEEEESEDEEEERVYLNKMFVDRAYVMKDDVFDPFLAACRVMGGGSRRGWDVKVDGDAVYLRMDMPGLSKENVKICVEQKQNTTLIIKGEGDVKESLEEEDSDEYIPPRYSRRIDLPPNVFKIDETKAEMKNGVLKIVLPKVKEEERKDVFQVKVD